MPSSNRIILPSSDLDALRAQLLEIRRTSSPKVASFADWALSHPQELAFNSVRSLADLAQVNANTVVRLAQVLGFGGFDECRRAFQEALRQNTANYSTRAAKLQGAASATLFDAMHESAGENLDAVFDPKIRAQIEQAATLLLSARQAYVIGVRSCFSLAHYLSYSGGMAFENYDDIRPDDVIEIFEREEVTRTLT